MKPLCYDIFAGLGGWAEGFLAEGWCVIGFDIERHEYNGMKYPGELIIRDALTIHGSELKDADCIVASPPCQEYSYMAMPWSRAKAIAAEYRSGKRDVKKLTALFDACFRIQREACEAAGRHIPMVVENVRGAQPWVGRARWNFGSFYLWGDVPALMPIAMRHGLKLTGNNSSIRWEDREVKRLKDAMQHDQYKTVGHINKRNGHDHARHLTNQSEHDGVKQGGDWFNASALDRDGQQAIARRSGSKSKARKAASAMIAKIPLVLAQWIARTYKPRPKLA